VVVCVAYYNGGGCWLLLVMKRGLVLRGRWIVGWLIRGMKKEKPKSLPVFFADGALFIIISSWSN